MPTITFTLTDEDVERIANRLAVKMADALKQVVAATATQVTQPKQQPKPSAEWLTSKQIQEMFQVTRSTVYRWSYEQGMPSRRIGGIVRFPAAKVMEWAEKHGISISQADSTI